MSSSSTLSTPSTLSTVRHEMWSSLRGYWDNAPAYVRLAYLVGVALMLTGLTHAAIWLVVGGSASGPLSWRKPTTFGLSFGLATLTLGWVATHLRVRRSIGWLGAIVLCASMVYEVAWATVQHARGVPSHFNDSTALDDGLFTAGAIAIAAAILVIVATTITACFRLSAAPATALAIRAGLLSLLVAQATGLWMVVHGVSAQDDGASMYSDSLTTYGIAGAMKFAHAIPMHAIQLFGALAWLLGFSRFAQRTQRWIVAAAVVGYTGLVVVAVARTAGGLAPYQPLGLGTLGYLVAGGLVAGALGLAAGNVARRVISS